MTQLVFYVLLTSSKYSIFSHTNHFRPPPLLRYLYKGDVILDNALILVAGMFLGIVYYGDPWYSSPLPKRAFTGCPLGTCTTHLIIPLYTPFIHPLYTLYTRLQPGIHLCTPVIHVYTPYIHLTPLQTPLQTPHMHPIYAIHHYIVLQVPGN